MEIEYIISFLRCGPGDFGTASVTAFEAFRMCLCECLSTLYIWMQDVHISACVGPDFTDKDNEGMWWL